MFNRPKGNTRTYEDERQRLLETLLKLEPTDPQYKPVMDRIEQLDKIIKRSSEMLKSLIPASATVISLVGLVALQQFAGVVAPKALEMIVGRFNTKNPDEKD